MIKTTRLGALMLTALLAATLIGCGRAKRAIDSGKEAVRLAKDAQDGEVTIKGKDGETVHIDTTDSKGGGLVTSTDKDGNVTTLTVNEDEDGEGGSWTMTGPDGTRTVTSSGDDESATIVTMDEEGNTTTFEHGADAVDEDAIGIKFYPGAEIEPGTAMSATGGEAGGWAAVSLTTPDSFAKVSKFYKDEYGSNVAMESGEMLMMTTGEDTGAATIMIAREQGEDVTRISIMKGEM